MPDAVNDRTGCPVKVIDTDGVTTTYIHTVEFDGSAFVTVCDFARRESGLAPEGTAASPAMPIEPDALPAARVGNWSVAATALEAVTVAVVAVVVLGVSVAVD